MIVIATRNRGDAKAVSERRPVDWLKLIEPTNRTIDPAARPSTVLVMSRYIGSSALPNSPCLPAGSKTTGCPLDFRYTASHITANIPSPVASPGKPGKNIRWESMIASLVYRNWRWTAAAASSFAGPSANDSDLMTDGYRRGNSLNCIGSPTPGQASARSQDRARADKPAAAPLPGRLYCSSSAEKWLHWGSRRPPFRRGANAGYSWYRRQESRRAYRKPLRIHGAVYGLGWGR